MRKFFLVTSFRNFLLILLGTCFRCLPYVMVWNVEKGWVNEVLETECKYLNWAQNSVTQRLPSSGLFTNYVGRILEK